MRLALSGFGTDTLIMLTRADTERCPTPRSVSPVPRTGFPPLTIIPARGWNCFAASTKAWQARPALPL
ncbi:MAG: hypothetical protein DMD28_03240 [Gemmatimonadetes bacterium]|nr:MAG: hypothetical protein DMD28_03240 [Gemmatimonadota bacterium]